jgi:hypothetical protein
LAKAASTRSTSPQADVAGAHQRIYAIADFGLEALHAQGVDADLEVAGIGLAHGVFELIHDIAEYHDGVVAVVLELAKRTAIIVGDGLAQVATGNRGKHTQDFS